MCGTTSHMMKDKLIVGEHQVDGTQLLIYILYIFIGERSERDTLRSVQLRIVYIYIYIYYGTCNFCSYNP